MALRNQPYLPLYVKDFLTDEKLIECSAESTGVYIRLMCIMHNAQNYGQLKLGDKYNDQDIVKNYSNMLTRQMPYTYEVIYKSLQELLRENVIFFMKNTLTQKRMFNDGLLSQERAKAGKIGGKRSKQNESKIVSKNEANTEYEYVYNNIIKYYNNIELNNIFIEYLNMRKKLKAVNSERAIKSIMNKLEKFNDDTKYKMIEQSIIHSWKDIYELKEQDIKPTWYGKDISKEQMSKEDTEEMKNILKGFE